MASFCSRVCLLRTESQSDFPGLARPGRGHEGLGSGGLGRPWEWAAVCCSVPSRFLALLTTLRNNTAAAGRAFLPDEQDAEEKGGRRELGLDHLMGLCLKGREGRGWRRG